MKIHDIFESRSVRVFTATLLVIFGLSVVLALGLVGLVVFYDKSFDVKIFALVCVLAFLPALVFGIFLWFLKWHYSRPLGLLGLEHSRDKRDV
jgi:biotin transporter BioY